MDFISRSHTLSVISWFRVWTSEMLLYFPQRNYLSEPPIRLAFSEGMGMSALRENSERNSYGVSVCIREECKLHNSRDATIWESFKSKAKSFFKLRSEF